MCSKRGFEFNWRRGAIPVPEVAGRLLLRGKKISQATTVQVASLASTYMAIDVVTSSPNLRILELAGIISV
jgi:hypothetical protein